MEDKINNMLAYEWVPSKEELDQASARKDCGAKPGRGDEVRAVPSRVIQIHVLYAAGTQLHWSKGPDKRDATVPASEGMWSLLID